MPENFDWQKFLGPVYKMPYDWNKYENWRLYKEFGAGILSDLLTHWADVAQWMMDDPEPINAVSTGGIYYLVDGRSNPDSANSIIQYNKGWQLSFESTILPVINDHDSVLFHGTKGKLELFRIGFRCSN